MPRDITAEYLEARLAELLQIGVENDAIGEKIHRLCLALLAAQDLQSLLAALYLHLHDDFAVPHAALRIWRAGGSAPEFGPVSAMLGGTRSVVGRTTTEAWAVLTPPRPSLTFNVAVNVPSTLYAWIGDTPLPVVASPKSQSYVRRSF